MQIMCDFCSTTSTCSCQNKKTNNDNIKTAKTIRRSARRKPLTTRSFVGSLLAFVYLTTKSEAFATTFVPLKSIITTTRGGASSPSKYNRRDPLTCVLQMPKPQENGLNEENQLPRNGKSMPSLDSMSSNGAPVMRNGARQSKNGVLASISRGGDDGDNVLDRNSKSSSRSSEDYNPMINDAAIARGGATLEAAQFDRLRDAEYVAETNLPTQFGHYRLRAYRIRSDDDADDVASKVVGSEPSVIYCTNKPPFGKKGKLAQNVPVRIHDQCFTSEVFGSQRCDCRDQLRMALDYIKENGGLIIYLQQEGRGIGLANKVAAYALQDVGMDTVDANLHLGLPEDCRQYGSVPSMLKDMNIGSINIMTNNPRKIERLRKLGVTINDRIPMIIPKANPHNRKYLETKSERMDHRDFGNMLSKSPPFILSSIDLSSDKTTTKTIALPEDNVVPLAEEYITDGEEMAANAITSCLQQPVDVDKIQEGVVARDDGYCFGKQSVIDAIAAVKNGELVVVVDDMDRENEGDFIMAADLCTPETMAQIVRYSSGVVCIGMEGKRMDELKLPSMVSKNEDPKGTAFSVTVDATKEHGITTGISAVDRAKTIQLLASEKTTAKDFHRPGHIFPLRAREGGVLSRDGHTEAAVDLSKLAGLSPNGVLCEIVSEENPVEMARLPELKRFCKRHGYVLTSIVDIAQYRRETEQ